MEKKKPYLSWMNGDFKSEQKEYTSPTKLLDDKGNLLCAGWARHNIFEYDRTLVKPFMRGKEWEYYIISNGKKQVVISFANISIGGFVSAIINDIATPPHKEKKQLQATIVGPSTMFVGGKNKYVVPASSEGKNSSKFHITGIGDPVDLFFNTDENARSLDYFTHFKGKELECHFAMDIGADHENITTVIPFKDKPNKFFMTTKQNCMPCSGYFRYGDDVYTFSNEDTFCTMDWGRVNAPYRVNWYWGNGSTYIYDEKGNKHTFGFEITWGIGDESKATETCIFYDGKAHKFGPVDVETFPDPDKYMDKWVFRSEDKRFEFTMTPFYNHFSDLNVINLARVRCNQTHGKWSGTAILDDGTKLNIHDMYAFCEYVENKW